LSICYQTFGFGREQELSQSSTYLYTPAFNNPIAQVDIIPPELLIQTKSETYLIESNNMPQRHWFARFRGKAVCVSRSEDMVDLTVGYYTKFHVNYKMNFDYFFEDIIN
jgi:hypothetical protein